MLGPAHGSGGGRNDEDRRSERAPSGIVKFALSGAPPSRYNMRLPSFS